MAEYSKQVLAAAHAISIRARRSMPALLEGNYRSRFRGSGMQFKEFRPYEPGDDIRHVSWNVTARTGRPTLKVYEQEREIDVVVLVDVSSSSLVGTRRKKISMYQEIIAILGLATIASGDQFGLITFDDQVTSVLNPGRGRNLVRVALTRMLQSRSKKKLSDLSRALDRATVQLPHRSLVIVLSDFLVPEFEGALKRISKRHECVLILGYDDRERGGGLSGLCEFQDPETGEVVLLEASTNIRKILAQGHDRLMAKIAEISDQTRSDFLPLSVQDDYVERLVRFFNSRGPARL
jgi:uncharacterized protein (DUF58 family)